jgi:hypothetical protein
MTVLVLPEIRFHCLPKRIFDNRGISDENKRKRKIPSSRGTKKDNLLRLFLSRSNLTPVIESFANPIFLSLSDYLLAATF